MKRVIKKSAKKPKRHVLGVGYPWFTPCSEQSVVLYEKCHGRGERVRLKIGPCGAWRKYRLVLVEV